MLILPETCRARLQQPFGRVFPDFSLLIPVLSESRFCTVGDVVTQSALSSGLVPDIAVIDGVTRRGISVSVDTVYSTVYPVDNPAGTITEELISVLRSAFGSVPALVRVSGEEDLAVLPLISLIPDSWIVVYGQPGEGAVCCQVDASLRRKVAEILADFVRK